MLPRLWFKPSQVAPTTRVTAYCVRCGTARSLCMGRLIASSFDVPLIEIERRLRCRDLGSALAPKTCGQPMEVGVWVPSMRGPSGLDEDLPILNPGVDYGG